MTLDNSLAQSSSSEGHSYSHPSSTTNVNLLSPRCDDATGKGCESGSGSTLPVPTSSKLSFNKLRKLAKSRFKKTKDNPLGPGTPIAPQLPSVNVTTSNSIRSSVVHESPTSRIPSPVDDHHSTIESRVQPDNLSGESLSPLSRPPRLRYDIFVANATKSVIKSILPAKPRMRFESTLQLVYCASLLKDLPPSIAEADTTIWRTLDVTARIWALTTRRDSEERTHIRWLLSTLVAEFVEDSFKGSAAIAEAVILGPVLSRQDYRALLSCFVERFEQGGLLDIDLLQGMVQLLQSASPGFLVDNDLLKIMNRFEKHFEDVHTAPADHVYQLVYAMSKVLEVMMGDMIQKRYCSRNYKPSLDAFRRLRKVSDDDILKFQVEYANQFFLHLDEERPLQKILRSTEAIVIGTSTIHPESKLSLKSAIAAVKRLQQKAGNANDVFKSTIDGRSISQDAWRSYFSSYCSGEKQAWFLILQAAHAFVREGRLVEFNQLVCDASCHFDRNFRLGVCQILGEITVNQLWDIASRQHAINFLGELYKNNIQQNDLTVKKWIVSILRQVANVEDVKDHALTLLDDLQKEEPIETHDCHPLIPPLPLPRSFPLLNRALDKPPAENDLGQMRLQRLQEYRPSVFIPLQAKNKVKTPDDESFSLKEKVLDFLESKRQVFLVLGDSGAGKSTFCRDLEHELWTNYQAGGRIPLFVNLSSIDRPQHDLVDKQLRHYNIPESKIPELKQYRQFVLICDGYDEARLSVNLHAANNLNGTEQCDVKLIISCRNTYLSRDYKGRFRPLGADHYSGAFKCRFEEAIIVPFTRSDIQTYVEHYVRTPGAQGSLSYQPDSSIDEYMEKLSVIPNMMDLVKNPFLLTLALKTLPFVSIDADNPSVIETTRLKLYDKFIKHWIRTSKRRLEKNNLPQDINIVFQQLLEANFRWCVIDYLKRLAGAIFQHQYGLPVVEYIQLKDDKTWRAEFFGSDIQSTLLREASPLSRAGVRHWFIHQSLLEYFDALGFHDPADYDEDDSDDDGDGYHGGGDNSCGSGDNSQGGDDSSKSGNDNPSGTDDFPDSGGSSADGSDGSPGGGGNCSGNSHTPPGNNEGSHGSKDSPAENKDGSRRDKDGSRSSDRKTSRRTRPSSTVDPFSRRNLAKEPAVLQFLVERAQSDKRLNERLMKIIQDSKFKTKPSLAAANAINILLKAGERLDDGYLKDVLVPRNYLSANFRRFASKMTDYTGVALQRALMDIADPPVIQIPPSSRHELSGSPSIKGSSLRGREPFFTTDFGPFSTDFRPSPGLRPSFRGLGPSYGPLASSASSVQRQQELEARIIETNLPDASLPNLDLSDDRPLLSAQYEPSEHLLTRTPSVPQLAPSKSLANSTISGSRKVHLSDISLRGQDILDDYDDLI
ncbi:Transducin (beta)-like 1 X-linked receptor 1 [Mortierella sp. AD031]|nr:Transducin (beta)-like 1 X-linked receptor 1 [Mortierella sp. AD031]